MDWTVLDERYCAGNSYKSVRLQTVTLPVYCNITLRSDTMSLVSCRCGIDTDTQIVHIFPPRIAKDPIIPKTSPHSLCD